MRMLFKRHKVLSSLLILYLLGWCYLIFSSFVAPREPYPRCDFSPLLYLYVGPFITVIAAAPLFIKYLVSKTPFRRDYLVFIILMAIPVITGLICLLA